MGVVYEALDRHLGRRAGVFQTTQEMAGKRIGFRPEKRDNTVMYLPKAFFHPREFADAVESVERKLGDKVIRIRHTLDYDSTGDFAVKFRVLMPDSSLEKGKLLASTQSVSNVILQELDPHEQWGVYPYFTFRGESEQQQMQEPTWA